MNLRLVLIIMLLIAFGKKTFSENSDSIINAIFKMIYNEEYEQAGVAIAKSYQKVDSFSLGILKIDLCWWEFIKSKNGYKSKELNDLIEGFTNSGSNPEDEKIRRLIASSYQIRLEFKRYNIIRATVLRSEIKELLNEIKKEDLTFSENRLKLLDLYASLFLYFDNLINPLFAESKRTSRANALMSLEKFTTDNDLVVQTMASYFLGKIFLEIEKDSQKGKCCFELLSTNFPHNSLFIELLENCK